MLDKKNKQKKKKKKNQKNNKQTNKQTKTKQTKKQKKTKQKKKQTFWFFIFIIFPLKQTWIFYAIYLLNTFLFFFQMTGLSVQISWYKTGMSVSPQFLGIRNNNE